MTKPETTEHFKLYDPSQAEVILDTVSEKLRAAEQKMGQARALLEGSYQILGRCKD